MTTPKGVPREFYDDAIRQRDAAQAMVAQLVAEIAALKRHDLGAFTAPAPDPSTDLGPRTLLAIEEAAGGDQELRNLLVRTALRTWGAEKREFTDPDELDTYVAGLVAAGDQDG